MKGFCIQYSVLFSNMQDFSVRLNNGFNSIIQNAIPVFLSFYMFTGMLGIRSLTPAGIYLLKAKKKNTRTRYEICSKLTIKTSERRH